MSSADQRKRYALDIEGMKRDLERAAQPPRIRYAQSNAIANIYDALGEDLKAASWYRRALQAHRGSSDTPSTELAILLWKLGNHENSRTCFKEVIAHYEKAFNTESTELTRHQISRRDNETAMSCLWLEDYERAKQIANDYIEGRRGFGSKAALYMAISIVVEPLANADKNALRAAIKELDERFPNDRPPDSSAAMQVRRFASFALETLEGQDSSG